MIIQEEWGHECLDRFELYHLDRLTPHEVKQLNTYRNNQDYENGIDLLKWAWIREKKREGFTKFYEENDGTFAFGVTFVVVNK